MAGKRGLVRGAHLLVVAALLLGSPALGSALAEPAKPVPAPPVSSLADIPVFYIADAKGQAVEHSDAGRRLYLNRTQAALALGYERGQRAPARFGAEDIHLEVTDLSRAMALPGERFFVKPPTVIEAAADMAEAPLFLIRDKAGSPYTLRGADGQRRVYFFLEEADALDFVEMIVKETKAENDDIRLSLVPIEGVLTNMLATDKPETRNWAIWSNSVATEDAALLRAELKSQSAQLPVGKP